MLADRLAGGGNTIGKGLAVDDSVAVLLTAAAWPLGPSIVPCHGRVLAPSATTMRKPL